MHVRVVSTVRPAMHGHVLIGSMQAAVRGKAGDDHSPAIKAWCMYEWYSPL